MEAIKANVIIIKKLDLETDEEFLERVKKARKNLPNYDMQVERIKNQVCFTNSDDILGCSGCGLEKGHTHKCCFYKDDEDISLYHRRNHWEDFHFASEECYCGWKRQDCLDCGGYPCLQEDGCPAWSAKKRKRDETSLHTEAVRMLSRSSKFMEKSERIMKMMEENNSQFKKWLAKEKENLTDEE